ncbi:porin [Pararhizobium arenae]|uniref:porin n=1 Tax=Pararhizobium arenae TaxID=1856850 RepID=UPI00094B2060|nr:porin [Pararhizobium arenae]
MNIKSLLLGSAAALAAVSGAQAADAIVAAEPEPMEYVRVCDAFGTGYFYIPGTETCLSISGYVRTQINYDDQEFTAAGADWDARTKGYLTFAAKNDTEFGTLSSYINLEANDTSDTFLDGAWINIAGFDIGYFYNWWDDFGLSGETDSSGGNLTNSIRYTYDGGSFQAGASVEEIDGDGENDNVGVSGLIRGTVGGVDALLIGSYDFDAEEAAFKARLTAAVGPGTIGLMGIYATDPNFYWDTSEWSVAAEYKIQATDKFFITPAAQYFGDVDFADIDAWRVGVTAGYQITEGLRTLATVNYTDIDEAGTSLADDDSRVTGFLRLQRDF